MINSNKKVIRTRRDIQTYSGKVDQVIVPHKAYLRISCLEMEKSRRNKERENAIGLIGRIDARFKEIDAEKYRLLQALNQLPANVIQSPAKNYQKAVTEAPYAPDLDTGGFKIMY